MRHQLIQGDAYEISPLRHSIREDRIDGSRLKAPWSFYNNDSEEVTGVVHTKGESPRIHSRLASTVLGCALVTRGSLEIQRF